MTEPATRANAANVGARRPLPVSMLKACRPKQWAKNVLVFVAPAAAGVLTQAYELRLTVQGFVAFCLVSSATYLLNDVLDVESDRRHPTKRNRPIASGAVSVPLAVGMAVVLFVLGVAVAAWTNWTLAGIVAGYAVLTTSYSMFLKQVAVLDLVILSAGFILRLLGGAYAAGVEVSEWFLLVSLFGSLFIAGAKRFAEKKELGEEAAALRPTLGAYSVEYLGFIRSVAAAAVTISYCQWAVESGGTDRYATPWVQLSIIPFVIAILRYALLVDQGQGSAPEEVLAGDRQMQLMGVLLVGCLFLAVYL